MTNIDVTHPQIPDPRQHSSWQVRMADRIAGAFGTMGMFWGLVIWQLGWITLATAGAPLFKSDPYPFVFCLFLSNLIQLWALPILGTATNRADAKREVKAEIDHQALTYLAQQLDGLRADVKAMQVPEAGRPTQNEVR